MSTSNRTVLFEASVASAIVFLVVVLSSPGNLAVPSFGVHPAWLPVTLFAARYGVRGLWMSLLVVVGPLVIASQAVNGSAADLIQRAHNPSDVVALFTAIVAAWVGMSHGARVRRVTRQLHSARDTSQAAEKAAEELDRAGRILRGRCDRLDASVTVWRSLASRLERGSPPDAAMAALELCSLRCPSAAAMVQRYGDGEASIVARRGVWRIGDPRPRDLDRDLTVQAAVGHGQLVCATSLDGCRESDSDVAIPVFDELDGHVVGVIALRGVAPDTLRASELRDLSLIAEWLAAPLARMFDKPRLRAVPEETHR